MKNKRNFLKNISWIWITIGLLLGIVLIMIIMNYIRRPQICKENICFTVEMARTPQEQQQGLMYRTSMAEKEGMIFVFPNTEIHNFRMKNTLIPLDMIWLDETYTVVSVITAQPCTSEPCPLYSPHIPVKYVWEINAGMANKYEIETGIVLQFRNIE